MKRIIGVVLIIFLVSCSKQDLSDAPPPLEQDALLMAASRCQSGNEMKWLREIIALSEDDLQYKGAIYAIPVTTGTIFLHQPWISSCYGCRLYNCEGDTLTLTEGERSEVLAGAKDENLIYTSSQ